MQDSSITDFILSLYKPMILFGIIAYGLFMITAIFAFRRKMKLHKLFAFISLGASSVHSLYIILYSILTKTLTYITLVRVLGFITYGLFIMTIIFALSKKFKLHKIFALSGFISVFLHLFFVIYNLY